MQPSHSQLILNSLIHDKDFSREVLPYIKEEYFEAQEEQLVFRAINNYANEYGTIPNPAEVFVNAQSIPGIPGVIQEHLSDLFENHIKDRYVTSSKEWIRDLTEKYCRDRALFLAIQNSIQIYDEETGKISRDAIPDMIREALAVSFDNSVGHDYFEDAEEAHAAYNDKEVLIPFKLPIFTKITNGGVTTRTLNLFMGGTNTFKTGFLCDLAAGYLSMGLDVLYVTLEMSEYKIRERIDANLTKLRINEVKGLLKPHYVEKIQKIKESTNGRLFIKEYPMTSANANHFRSLLKELELKKSFKPKIIIVDYVSICASIRVKDSSNLYSYNKAIVEELRGLAQENDIVMWSAIQTNRSGQDASDLTLENTSESHGVPMTADLLWGIINTEDLESKGLIMIKQLKSRYGDKSHYRRVILGVDKARMTVFEPDESVIDKADLNPEDQIYGDDLEKKSNKFSSSGFKF